MLSCARGFAGLYFCDDRAPLLQAHLRALPGGGRPAGEAMEPAHRPAAVEEASPLQRAGHRARGGQRRDALAATQGAGRRRGGPATRDRRATHPGGIPPHRQGSRARARHRRTRALGRAVDVADRIFLETTRRFAPARLAREDVSTALTLVQVEPAKPIADLGCGYGRHLAAFVEQGHAHPLGVDRSALLLEEARAQAPSAHLLRGDLRALPLHAGSLAAAFCFYSSMFLGTHADAVAALREAARVLRPGGGLVLTTDNPLRLAARPHLRYEEDVPGLGRIVEESEWDAKENVDRVRKTLRTPAGENLSATFSIRYYAPPRLIELAGAAGFILRRLEPESPLTEETRRLIALLGKVRGWQTA